MRIVIRTDASAAIGLGHVQRCLALAHALKAQGAQVEFITRALGVDAAARIRAAGFAVRELPAPAGAFTAASPAHAQWAGVPWEQDARETAQAAGRPDWIVVDHYAFDERWHRAVCQRQEIPRSARDDTSTCHPEARRAEGSTEEIPRFARDDTRLAVIDDLADRPLACDLLIDHTYAADHRRKYAGRVAEATAILGGPQYALLGPAYAQAPRHAPRADVKSIGIFMGGLDAGGYSRVALRACRELAGLGGDVEITTTGGNPQLRALEQAVRDDGRARLSVDLPDLAGFFARHDLQIGAGGGATWERCCIGAPTIAIAVADNQRAVLEPLRELGVLRIAQPSAEAIAQQVRELGADPTARRALATRARELVDGNGAGRVARYMLAA